MAEFPYFVIELERFPHASYQSHIAVPSSWISPTLSQGLQVAVHLPTVDFQTMECLTKSGCGPGDDWGLYLGTQQIGNDNIEDAWKYAENHNSRRDSNLRKEKALTEVRKRKRRRKRQGITYAYLKSKKGFDMSSYDYADSDEHTPCFSQAYVKQRRIERALRLQKRTTAKENSKKGNAVQTAQQKLVQPSPSTSGTPQTHKQPVSMKNNYYRKNKLIKNLAKTFQLQDEKFNQLRESLNSLTPIFSSISNSINIAVSVIQECLDDIENEVDDKVDDDVNDITPKAGSSRFQNSKQSKTEIVYEYPDNSDKSKKWMLKYPEFQYKSGLVELMPRSGIYISESALKKCNENCKDPTELAHSLIFEVFSDAALRRCAMGDEYLVDALDYYALVVIEMYVKEFCVKNKYPISKIL